MKWSDIAKALIPVVGAFVPGAAPLVPLMLAGVTEADAIAGASGAAKKAHVENLVAVGAAGVSATGKVTINPGDAVAVTQAVFSAVDHVKAIVDQQPAA